MRRNAVLPQSLLLRVSLGLLLLCGLVWLTVHRWQISQGRTQGRLLYQGEVPLTGRLGGHATPLPPSASRCVNCHGVPGRAPPPAPSGTGPEGLRTPGPPVVNVAPPLGGEALTSARARRGGPASRFDPASFCTLLRTGVDPAYIVLPRAMPRYDITDADCMALWLYLTRD